MNLKPCPFCGSAKVNMCVGYDAAFHYVECEDCRAGAGFDKSKSKSISAWNARPVENELLDALKECQKQLLKSCNEKEIACARSCDKCVLHKARKIIEPIIEKYEVK